MLFDGVDAVAPADSVGVAVDMAMLVLDRFMVVLGMDTPDMQCRFVFWKCSACSAVMYLAVYRTRRERSVPVAGSRRKISIPGGSSCGCG